VNSSNHKNRFKDKSENLFSFIFNPFQNRRLKPRTIINTQTELDKKLVYSLSKSKIPSFRQLKYISRFLNRKELVILRLGLFVFLASLIFIGAHFYFTHLEIVPSIGGKYTEGVIGSPKYINPLYASANDADNDISSLVYSSLYKRKKAGDLIGDLAESLNISKDNLTYTIKIKDNVKWHNGSSLTVDDIIFTFNTIKDTDYHSPLRISFSGVQIDKIDDHNIRFTLSQPYAPFQELLTFGILPQEQWSQIPSASANLAAINLKPIGSGPFSFKSLIKDKVGNIKSITLVRYDDYYGQHPYLDEIIFKFYVNSEEIISALNKNEISGVSYLSKGDQKEILSADSVNFHELNIPQLTAIFFNKKNNPALDDKNIRIALALAIDKVKMVNEIFNGKYKTVDSPIIFNSFAYNPNVKKYEFNKGEAEKILDQAGWKLVNVTKEMVQEAEKNISSKNEEERTRAEMVLSVGEGNWRAKEVKKNENFLSINFVTIDAADNSLVVEKAKEYWEAIGVKTLVEIVPAVQVQADVIKPRAFDALFYGQILGADPDEYAFWHSSQAGENGLNISDFANKEVDQLLEDGRTISDEKTRKEKYFKFQEIITGEVPAIFMYSPTYTYVQDKTVKGFDTTDIVSPNDRFSDIANWYIKTKSKIIWK
jgi:peptide/nickel transport system substrate-binding protein